MSKDINSILHLLSGSEESGASNPRKRRLQADRSPADDRLPAHREKRGAEQLT